MRILNIIDSLELNGGSTMFLEMTAAMRKYWPDDVIVPIVVSKTGERGRKNLISDDLHQSYGINDLTVYSYETFQTQVASKERNVAVFHHILGHTKPLRLHGTCKYILVNHTMTNVKRLSRFRPYHSLVSVCNFFATKTKKETRLNSYTILNRIDDHYKECEGADDRPFVIGRCQRIVPSKFARMDFQEEIFRNGYRQMLVGPVNSGRESKRCSNLFSENDVLVGPVFDRQSKMELIRSFDVYLHSTIASEGASMAVLEALSCGVPVLANDIKGGIRDLVKHGVNGFFFRKSRDLHQILSDLQNVEKMKALKNSVRKDFLSRLHIKHSLKRYRKLAH